VHDFHTEVNISMILKRTAGHWYRRLVGRAWNKWYGDFLWDKQVRRTLAWVGGHWWRRQQGAAWNKWWAVWCHFKLLHPLRSERNQLLEHVRFHTDENNKLLQRKQALEDEITVQARDHAEQKEKLGKQVSDLDRENGELSRDKGLLELSKEQLAERCEELEKRLEQVRQQWDQSEAELSAQLENLVKERHLSEKAQREMEMMDGHILTLEEQLHKQINDMEQASLRSEADMRQLKKDLNARTADLQEAVAKLDRMTLDLESERARGRDEVMVLSDKLQHAE